MLGISDANQNKVSDAKVLKQGPKDPKTEATTAPSTTRPGSKDSGKAPVATLIPANTASTVVTASSLALAGVSTMIGLTL
ncbi:hypothetical protein ATCC90586_006416 [Pythium insidiosum]|nr:hypothetical protein ATCC90586_006416 [Pythium insidiosum]